MGRVVSDERMPDREIRDRFDSIDKRLDRMVPIDSWTLENDHVKEKFAELDRNLRERIADVESDGHEAVKRAEQAAKADVTRVETATEARFKRNEDRGQNTWSRVIGVVGIAATVIAAAWAAYMSSRGAH